MGEMLEQFALAQQWPDHALAIVLHAAPQDMVMRPHDVAHRVDLQEPQPADQPRQVGRASRWAGRRSGKMVRRQPEPPRLPVGNGKAVPGSGNMLTFRCCRLPCDEFPGGYHIAG